MANIYNNLKNFQVTEYHFTRGGRYIAKVNAYDHEMYADTAEAMGIPMVAMGNIDNGNFKVFPYDELMIYRNCEHTYKADRKGILEISASVKVRDLKETERLWLMGYSYFNGVNVLLSSGYIKFSFVLKKTDKRNLSRFSQHFDIMFENISAEITAIEYSADGVADKTEIDKSQVVETMQVYTGKQKTPKCYKVARG